VKDFLDWLITEMSPVVNSRMDHPRHHRQQQQQQQDDRCYDDELSCKICLGGYNDRSPGQRPRSLHCHHTFCESCLQQMLAAKQKQRREVSYFLMTLNSEIAADRIGGEDNAIGRVRPYASLFPSNEACVQTG